MTKRRRRGAGPFVLPESRLRERHAIVERRFRGDLTSWVDTNPRIAAKVLTLVEDVMRDPHSGLGKPEPLKHGVRTAWSRRITHEHRLVYEITDMAVYFLAAAGHYTN